MLWKKRCVVASMPEGGKVQQKMGRVESFLKGFPDPRVVVNVPVGMKGWKPLKTFALDNDGTVHNIRASWKKIMEGYMMSILTRWGRIDTVSVVDAMREEVRRLIYETDGINTIEQMAMFREIVTRWRATDSEIALLDPEIYKLQYVREMQKVALVTWTGLLGGTVDPMSVIVDGAITFLVGAKEKGAHCFVFSGTDEPFVQGDLYHIGLALGQHWEQIVSWAYGARLDSRNSCKEKRMAEYLATSGVDPKTIAVVGDGPVELEVGHKAGCYLIGIARDQARRDFLTQKLRERTKDPQATVHLFIPHFGVKDSETDALVEFLMAA